MLEVALPTAVPRVSVAPVDARPARRRTRDRRLAGSRLSPAQGLGRSAEHRVATRNYTYVLVDCPPSLNLLTINAMAAAHSILVPLQCEFFALEGLSQLLQTVEQVKQSLNPELTIHGIVLTMFDSRNNLSGQVVADVRAHMGEAVYETIIPRNVRVSEAPSYGKPVLLYDFKSTGSQAYLRLAAEIIQRERQLRAA